MELPVFAHLKGTNGRIAFQEMLIGYRSTPQPATRAAPYEALVKRHIKTKLDYQTRESSDKAPDTAIDERDERYKEKIKQNAENLNTKEHNYIVRDPVLLKLKEKKMVYGIWTSILHCNSNRRIQH